MENKGFSMAFCGLDGTGKSTQIKNVETSLQSQNFDTSRVKLDFSPFNDYGKSKISNYILNGLSGFIIIKEHSYFHVASKKHDFTLYDRHILCYLAYAHAMGIKSTLLLKKGFSLYPPTNDPDLTLYFDIEVKSALDRISAKSTTAINKNETYETLSRAKGGYEMLIPHTKNVAVIDANKNSEDVFLQISSVVTKKIGHKLF